MNESITITQADLRAALLRWEQEYRDGKTRTPTEALKLPMQQVVDESTAWMWSLLQQVMA